MLPAPLHLPPPSTYRRNSCESSCLPSLKLRAMFRSLYTMFFGAITPPVFRFNARLTCDSSSHRMQNPACTYMHGGWWGGGGRCQHVAAHLCSSTGCRIPPQG
jgi:hypothetical protein